MASGVWPVVRKWRRPLGAVAVGALLGVMGPFGSQTAFSTPVKYALWMVLALAGFGAAAAAERLLQAQSPPKSARRILAVGALSAVPMTFFVAWAFSVVQEGRTFSPLQLIGLYPFVALVQLLIARVIAVDEEEAIVRPGERLEEPPGYPPQLIARLPAAIRHDIFALEAEDHYVRVHARHGSALVLMRLADAAALIDPRLGLRVHRSWWVARDAVSALERSGQPVVRLVNGMAVPVSRTHLPAARAAFPIADGPARQLMS